ncbi:EamA/RhaT family transporter [Bizionia argentinensis JUB59]|uniref:EamA/RhaT family transporter n=1 Tax=Bizionia argentinensis JUB59 TaxID=1046627 RepID=G2EGN3_9FLAO|nr:EamA family transporter [Bizionia argentinensis]EGV42421.1 EamA/RhaT family transporter [Bizionia argentinensis JUB59]
MIYLLLSILASTIIFVLFKLFDKHQVNTLQAIVVNYITAFTIGIVTYEETINIQAIIATKWFYGAIILGFLFIIVFNVMAITSQRVGLSVASVATKMSVIIPVVFGIYVYNESAGLFKIIGIITALFAVYLSTMKSGTRIKNKQYFIYPIIIFLGTGVIDTSIKYIETTYLPDNGIPVFSATIFCFSAMIGMSMLIYQKIKGKFIFNPKSLLGGFFLGIANYASMYYILKALNHETLESSTIFTINNVTIILLTSLLGFFIFKEKLSTKNWIGISLAVISIYIITVF